MRPQRTLRTGGAMNTPAFPLEIIYTQENEKFNGMTLRDYFAAKAMHFCLKNCFTTEGAVQDAYDIADAMMKAREQ